MSSPRGPSDYAEDPEYLRAVIEGMVRANGYHESSDKGLLKWILGVLSALLIMLTPAMIVLYSDVQTLKAQMADVKRIVEPRYRGAEPGS